MSSVLKLADPTAASKRLAAEPAYQAAIERKAEAERRRHEKGVRRIAWLGRCALVARFPKCFAPHTTPKQPLKIGIRRDLNMLAPDPTLRGAGRCYDAALRDYTSGKKYLQAMIAGTVRVDLDGNAAGEVTERDAKDALNRLRKLTEKK